MAAQLTSPARPSLAPTLAWLLGAFLAMLPAQFSRAQCAGRWLPGDPIPGTNGQILTMTMWDPDGPGPHPPQLVLAGQFTLAGNVKALNIVAYDPATGVWSSLGDGFAGSTNNGQVRAVLAMPDGSLIAGGDFEASGSVPLNRVARWDGHSWVSLGPGFTASGAARRVDALALAPNGDVIAAGAFSAVENRSTLNIARWNGREWNWLGSGLSAEATALHFLPNGDLLAAGRFTSIGGVPAKYVARWNGTEWSALGSGPAASAFAKFQPIGLTLLPTGDVVLNASTDSVSINSPVQRWDGHAWHDMSAGLPISPNHLMLTDQGVLMAASGENSNHAFWEWNGSSWSGSGPTQTGGGANCFGRLADGRLVAAGTLNFDSQFTSRLAVRGYDGRWRPLLKGLVGAAYALAQGPDHEIVVGGAVTAVSEEVSFNLFHGNPGHWSGFRAGVDGEVDTLLQTPDGDVVIGGKFQYADHYPVNHIARWDGLNLLPLGAGLTKGNAPFALALATSANGNLLVGGEFGQAGGGTANLVARWDGEQWNAFPNGLGGFSGPYVDAIAVDSRGGVIVGGVCGVTGDGSNTNIARCDGSNWSALGKGLDGAVYAIQPLPDGRLVAAGAFHHAGGSPASRVAIWDGIAWSAMGEGFNSAVEALTLRPDGTLIAAGDFTASGSVPVNHLAAWNGASWSTWHGGTDATVFVLRTLADGDLVLGGSFSAVGDIISPCVARWSERSRADVNDDGVVDIMDFTDFITCFEGGTCPPGQTADFNRDGFPDIFDFTDFVDAFELGC